MKKLLASILVLGLMVTCLAACRKDYRENQWFSKEKLSECLVPGLPEIQNDYVNKSDEDIYVNLKTEEYQTCISELYEYLKAQNFKYFGTRGGQKATLAGTFTTYYFSPATELAEFLVDGAYRFVFSDGTTEDGKTVFRILTIYAYSGNLEYSNKFFPYNTVISLRKGSETLLSGLYVLKEAE